MLKRLFVASAMLLVVPLGCDDDDDGDSAADAGDAGDAGDAAGSDGGGAGGPYDRCSADMDCPGDATCATSSSTCQISCMAPADCPTLSGAMIACEAETCTIPCGVDMPCPGDMVCIAGILCGYS